MSSPDEDAFLQLVRENEARIRKICRVYTNGPEKRRDLFQDVLIELWRSLPSFEGEAEVGTWMYRVALNTALTRDRSEERRENAILSPSNPIWSDSFDPPGGKLESDERLERLYAAIDRLDEIDRALVLMYLDERPYQEMAEVLGMSVNHVSVKLHRVKAQLSEWLNDSKA